jgi:hypothetical protein
MRDSLPIELRVDDALLLLDSAQRAPLYSHDLLALDSAPSFLSNIKK